VSRAGRFVSGVAIGLLGVTLPGTTKVPDPASPPLTPPEHRRPPEQTFLTFPEWFLVFSPAEYARHVAHRPPSEFPFLGHVAQFWNSYRAVCRASQAYPLNTEYHVMIGVIGLSTTVEYGLRAAYETLVGRLSELATDYGTTEEDRLASAVAQEYVDFIRVEPWYRFDYLRALRRLWGTSLWGRDALRKWERKYALTTEYGAKALYAVVIRKSTGVAYGEAVPVTAVVVRPLSQDAVIALPKLEIQERFADGSTLVLVPRYEAFTHHAVTLARHGAQFVEVAGNRGEILVTALVPRGDEPLPGPARILFSQEILTEPGTRRLAIVVPVAGLGPVLAALEMPPRRLEHIFDY
jgi:hypothetical protein